jgi:TPR repeat protein/class 3 adenylate cyclase
MREVGDRELLAIIFTDAVGSSSQTALDEDKSLSMLMADLDFIRNEAGVRGGIVLKNTGDGLLISFKSAVDAVECALAIQKSFQSRPKGVGFEHKVGVHIGDVIKKDGDIYGAGVNTASRLVDQCEAGGICISSTLYELTKQKSEIGRLKLEDFLLQNTEPPTLAYRNLTKSSVEKHAPPRNSYKKATSNKTPLIKIGLFSLLIMGISFFLYTKEDITKKEKSNSEKFGFSYQSGPSKNIKASPHGAPVEVSVENNTDLSLEFKWLQQEEFTKASDRQKDELSLLGPGKDILWRNTSLGSMCGIYNSQSGEMLGSFHILAGRKLKLVINKTGDEIRVEPKYYESALRGDALAQARLSEMFWTGDGMPKDDNEALHWAMLSFERGNSYGTCMMAALLDAGTVVPVDRRRAMEYWQKAASAGEQWGYARLGDRYLYGRFDATKDYEQAIRWLTLAKECGNDWATANLGRCHEKGWGVPVDYIQALQLYQQSAANGYSEGITYLHQLLQVGLIPETVGNCKYASDNFSIYIADSSGSAFYRWPENANYMRFYAKIESPGDLSLLVSGPGSAPVFALKNQRETLNAILGGWKNTKSIFQIILPNGKVSELGSCNRLASLPPTYNCLTIYGPEGCEIFVDGKSLIKTKNIIESKPEFFSIGTCWNATAKLTNVFVEFK